MRISISVRFLFAASFLVACASDTDGDASSASTQADVPGDSTGEDPDPSGTSGTGSSSDPGDESSSSTSGWPFPPDSDGCNSGGEDCCDPGELCGALDYVCDEAAPNLAECGLVGHAETWIERCEQPFYGFESGACEDTVFSYYTCIRDQQGCDALQDGTACIAELEAAIGACNWRPAHDAYATCHRTAQRRVECGLLDEEAVSSFVADCRPGFATEGDLTCWDTRTAHFECRASLDENCEPAPQCEEAWPEPCE